MLVDLFFTDTPFSNLLLNREGIGICSFEGFLKKLKDLYGIDFTKKCSPDKERKIKTFVTSIAACGDREADIHSFLRETFDGWSTNDGHTCDAKSEVTTADRGRADIVIYDPGVLKRPRNSRSANGMCLIHRGIG